MAKELKLQTDIIKSVRKDGGYGRKMSNQFAIGIPDLLIGLFPFAPVLVEVKDLGPVYPKFNQKLDVTPKQYDEMRKFNTVYQSNQHPYTPHRRAAFIMVGFSMGREFYLSILPHDAERLDFTCLEKTSLTCSRGLGGYYPISPLLENAGAIKISSR